MEAVKLPSLTGSVVILIERQEAHATIQRAEEALLLWRIDVGSRKAAEASVEGASRRSTASESSMRQNAADFHLNLRWAYQPSQPPPILVVRMKVSGSARMTTRLTISLEPENEIHTRTTSEQRPSRLPESSPAL